MRANCAPESLLKISGRPSLRAASSASRQTPASSVADSAQLSTYRLNQSITATSYRKPRRIGTSVMSLDQT